MVAVKVSDKNHVDLLNTIGLSDDEPVYTMSDHNRPFLVNTEGTDSTDDTGDGSGREESRSLLSQQEIMSCGSSRRVHEADENTDNNKTSPNKPTERKVSFEVPPPSNSTLPKRAKKRKDGKKKEMKKFPLKPPENDPRRTSERKMHRIKKENKSLKEENKYLQEQNLLLQKLLTDVVKHKESETKKKGDKEGGEPSTDNTTDDNHYTVMEESPGKEDLGVQRSDVDPSTQDKMRSLDINDDQKVPERSKTEQEDGDAEMVQPPLQLGSNGKIFSFFPAALLSHRDKPKKEENDTVTTAPVGSESSTEMVRKDEPRGKADSNKELSSNTVKGAETADKGEVSSTDAEREEKYQKAAMNMLSGSVEMLVSLTLELEVAKDDISTMKMAHTKELKEMEEKRLEEVQLLKDEVIMLEEVVDGASQKSELLEKYLEEFESKQTKKLQALQEEHKKEKELILECHTKELEDYQSQVHVLKKALANMVKKLKKEKSTKSVVETEHIPDTNSPERTESKANNRRLALVMMHYEKKIEGMEKKHLHEVKRLQDGSGRLRSILLEVERERALEGSSPKSDHRSSQKISDLDVV